MKRVLLLTILFAGCQSSQKPHVEVSLASLKRNSDTLSGYVESAKSDGKEVKKLHKKSMSISERIDYKTSILLK